MEIEEVVFLENVPSKMPHSFDISFFLKIAGTLVYSYQRNKCAANGVKSC